MESFDAFQKGFVDALLDQHVAPEARAGIRDAIERGLSIQDNIIDDVLGFIEGYPVNSFSDHVGDENIQRDATIGVGDAWSYSNYDHGMWLEASPAVIEPGEQTTISLHGQHDLSRNHRCDGLRSHPGFKPRELGKPITLSQDTTFRYHCYETGESGVEDLTLSITVVVAPEPEATLSASRETIEVGQSVTLNWRSQHAQQCRGGLIAARDVESPWPGTKTLSGSMTVTPQINTTYVLACEGRGGVSGEAVTVQVTGTVLESDLRANATLEQIEHTRVSAINSGIHVYEEPRGDAHVHDVMPMGARGTILSSEPITIAGQSFHKIRFDNGVEGWVREGGVIRDSNEELRRRVPRAAGCHRIRSMLVSLPEGYGAPFNFFSEAKEPTIRTICDETGAYLSVGTGMDNEFIFHRGLEWRDGSWKPLRLTGAKKAAGGQWIVGKAERFVDRRNTESQEPHFVLAYTCTWNDGAWRCGCRNEQCARPHWQLQVIRE